MILSQTQSMIQQTARAFAEASGATEKVYGETGYRAGEWKKERRVIVKADGR